MINEEKDYKLKGYKTVFHFKNENKNVATPKTRMVCLIAESAENIKVREDLMSKDFPSIWCEVQYETEKNILICGFYREWSHEGVKYT